MAQRKNMQKYGTLIFMFIMVDPPAVKTRSEVAMRFVNEKALVNYLIGKYWINMQKYGTKKK